MRKRYRGLAWALAGALMLASIPGVPVAAEGNVVYVSTEGFSENSGMTAESPLASIYAAQELLPEGGTILVEDTIYVTGERSYVFHDGITLQAGDELEGPLFEVSENGRLTLGNIILTGNSSTVISNHGVLKIDDSVTLTVKDGEGVGCVYTGQSAATYLNDELVAGDGSVEKTQETEQDSETESPQSESEGASETEKPQKESEEDSETEKIQDESTGVSETEKPQKEGVEDSETEKPQDESAGVSETEKPQKESGESSGTEKPQDESAGASETEKPQKESGESSETEKPQGESAGASETEKPQGEGTGAAETESELLLEQTEQIRSEAVETVKNAIVSLSIHSRKDVKGLLAVSQAFDGLTDAERAAIPEQVRQLLESAKQMAAAYNHTQRGVSVYGNIPWYVQFRVKLTDIGEKEEKGMQILVPYELKLWNLFTDSVYTLPEGESVTVTMPVPDVDIEGEFTVFHYHADGSVESIRPVINGNMMSFETSSFSPFSVAGSMMITGVGIGNTSGGGTSSGSSTGNGDHTTGNTSSGSAGTSGGGNTSGTGTPGTGSSSTGGSVSGSSTGSSTGSYVAAVNTGDNTKVFPAVLLQILAFAAIAGVVLRRRKENS
ncbi:MAG: hypothetical protein SPD93_08960 [Lachnospiraceae bacterium]|nr:hypothetical protein [Lachnospiraceae bacterium]